MNDSTEQQHAITAVKQQHPKLGEFWDAHCSCGNISTLYRTEAEAERAVCDHEHSSTTTDFATSTLNALVAKARGNEPTS